MNPREKYKVERKYISDKASSSFIIHYKRLHIEEVSFKKVEILLIIYTESACMLGICNPYSLSTLPLL